MRDKTAPRPPEGPSSGESFTLGRHMKGMVWFYWMAVVLFAGIGVAAIRRQGAAGNLQPMNSSNLNLVGAAVFMLSLLALLLGCGYAFLLLAKTTISPWGIVRPSWLGGLAVPWTEVALVTPDPIGLRFKTKTGKTLIIPFRIFDSVPPKLLNLLSKQIPRPALAGLDPDAPASWWSEQSR
jgi:hypothetical protein